MITNLNPPHAALTGGHVPPPPPPPGAPLPPPPPQPELPPPPVAPGGGVDVQNLMLWLGALSLVAAAISVVAANWQQADASLRTLTVLGATGLALVLARAAKQHELPGTSSTLAATATCLGFLSLSALQQSAFPDTADDLYLAWGGLVLLMGFAAMQIALPGRPARLGMFVSWWIASWSMLSLADVEAFDLYVASLALASGVWQLARTRGRSDASSWDRYGTSLLIAGGASTLTALADPGLARPLTLLGIATAVLLIGVATRQRAPITVAALCIGTLAGVRLVTVSAEVPEWIVLATVGVVLLVAGATFEQQRKNLARLRGHFQRFR